MSLSDLATEPLIDLLSTHDLLRLPPVSWLMEGLIPENGLVGLYGPPSSGKSFVGLDWAMCISEGMPWLGHATKPAPVIYIAAEGGRGIQKRVKAWMQAQGKRELPGMYWLLHPLYVREEGVVEAFLQELEYRDIFPGLVVLDTLSRSFGGGEENSSADMGEFVDSVTRLAAGRHMSALVVHHTNATAARERGHSSLRGASDAMFSCTAEKNGDGRIVRLTLTNDKQKDAVEAQCIYMQPREDVTLSLLFEEAPPPEKKERGSADKPMRRQDMLTYLGGHPEGLTFKEWIMGTSVPESTFKRSLAAYKKNSDVYTDGGKYFATPTVTDLANAAQEDV